ncbi:MAG TPA: Spy/CpxP family protein refolding chaperone [Burkholderiales bacterium]|nr:Spy/CpxP family protein refolding chaperone [Burkholderiales bacterium]
MTNLRLFRLRTVFDGSHPAAVSSTGGYVDPDPVVLAREYLGQLEHDLGITADERTQWTAFSRNVLVRIGRVSAARQAARNSAVSDPARADLKRELIRQAIVTPGLLSQAAKDLYAALTPEQQRQSGEKLLNFHRRLVG